MSSDELLARFDKMSEVALRYPVREHQRVRLGSCRCPVRSGRVKSSLRQFGDAVELYDVTADPHQQTNVGGDNRAAVSSLHAILLDGVSRLRVDDLLIEPRPAVGSVGASQALST